MATTTQTPYMSLFLPVPLGEVSPFAGATDINSALTLVDAHDHSSGKGVPVPTAGLNINADLTFAGFNATSLRAVKMANQSSALAGVSDVGCLYVSGGDLYYNSSSGQQVHLTSGGAINISSTGGISGLSGTNAALTYSSVNQTFTFTQNSGVTASIASGPISISKNVSSSAAITIQAPSALTSSFTMTLPTAPPTSATSYLVMDTSGNVTPKQTAPQLSASCGAWTNATSTPTAVTNLSVTITTTGRPVVIVLINDGSGNVSAISVNSFNSDAAASGIVQILSGTTVISAHAFEIVSQASGSGIGVGVPVSSVYHLDMPAAGTYTYSIKAYQNTASGSKNISISYCKLLVYEL